MYMPQRIRKEEVMRWKGRDTDADQIQRLITLLILGNRGM